MSTPDEPLDFLTVDEQLQQRWPETRIEPSLARMRALMDLLGDPQKTYPIVHITGTNGKSSTARMIDELFRALGLRTGRYTSPHLASVRERISIDGVPIDEQRFVDTYRDVLPYLHMVDTGLGVDGAEQQVPVSFFEAMTAMAYAAFADAPVNVAIVEVGLGGEWDATNIGDGKVAVLTPIGIDHAALLGETRAEIAKEKAGIIKAGSTAVTAKQEEDALEVILQRASIADATIAREGDEFGVVDRQLAVGGQVISIQGLGARYDNIFLPLFGAHQAENAAVALAAVEAFFGSGNEGSLDAEAVSEAFSNVSSPGRLEIVRTAPTILLDSAHNPHGMKASVDTLNEEFDFRRLIGVFAAMADKDVNGMLDLLEPVLDEIIITRNNSSRSADIDTLAAVAVEYFGADRVTVEPRLSSAIEMAIELAEQGDSLSGAGVLVTGSVVTAGDARILLQTDRKKPWE